MPFPDSSFDAVYAFEATVHAPSLQGIYSEIHRVLKPGGVVGIYEWLMTDKYDNENMNHRRIRLDIEEAFGVANMVKVSDALAAIKASGLELETHIDVAIDKDGLQCAPWYCAISGDVMYVQTISDIPSVLRRSRWGVMLASLLLYFLAFIRIVPAGAKKTFDTMGKGTDALVSSGKQELFTPMYLLVARKPKA